MLTEAVINLVDIHDRLVTSLVYCAISHWYYTSSTAVAVDFLYCLVCLREILLHKKNQNMEEIQGGHCPFSKIQGGQPTTLSPPCRGLHIGLHIESNCVLMAYLESLGSHTAYVYVQCLFRISYT